MRGVLIEGVACAGKSTLLRALLTHHAFLERAGMSSLVLTEHHTLRVLEDRRGALTVADNVGLLVAHVDYVSGLADRLARVRRWEGRPNPRLTVIFERFHLSHVLTYDHVRWEDVDSVDARLAELGVRLCLVVASRAELRRRLIADRGAGWATFLGERGVRDRLPDPADSDACLDYFVRQQDAYRALAGRSRLSVTELDTSEISLPVATERLFALLG